MKNKAYKMARKFQEIENPVVVRVTIDTDDDFKVNDVYRLEKELEFRTLDEIEEGVFKFLGSLEFKRLNASKFKVDSFIELLKSDGLRVSVSEIGDVVMPGTPHEWVIDKAYAGGNQSVIIELMKS